jgi:hypothetical protein
MQVSQYVLCILEYSLIITQFTCFTPATAVCVVHLVPFIIRKLHRALPLYHVQVYDSHWLLKSHRQYYLCYYVHTACNKRTVSTPLVYANTPCMACVLYSQNQCCLYVFMVSQRRLAQTVLKVLHKCLCGIYDCISTRTNQCNM